MSKTISWDDQRIFLAVVEEGSLSGAARSLGLSHPTIRSRIDALELALGTSLFTRSPNGLTPTEAAHSLVQPAKTMKTASALFVRMASAPLDEISGTVRLSVPDFMGIEVMPPMLKKLRALHPDIEIELSLSNKPADLLSNEVDVAVRTVAPKQLSLIAKKVARIPLGLFAAKSYLDKRGYPQTMEDLVDHDLIGPDQDPYSYALIEQTLAPEIQNRIVVRTDNQPAHIALARKGVGIASSQVPLSKDDPELVRVLPDLVVATLETWIVTHENLRQVPRINAVFESLVDSFEVYGRGR